MFRNKHRGSVTLTTVIVVSGVLIAMGIALILTTMDMAFISKDSFNANYLMIRSDSCIEEAMRKLKSDALYTGTVTVSYSDGTCSTVVTNDAAPNIKVLTVNVTRNEYNYARVVKANVGTTPVQLVK